MSPHTTARMVHDRAELMEPEPMESVPMTLSDLHNAVGQLLPDDCRFDVTLAIRRHAPAYYFKKPDDQIAVVVEVSVWHRGTYEGIEAPTYQAALVKVQSIILPALNLDNPAPAKERLAEMDGAIAQVAALNSSGDVTVRCG